MVVFPSRGEWFGGLGPAPFMPLRPIGPPCRRCGESQRVANARYCARCGLLLPPPSDPNTIRYTEAMIRGRRLRGLGRRGVRSAIRSFREALACRPGSIEPMLEIAETCRWAGWRWRARRWYRLAILRRPDCFEAWRGGAECFGRHARLRRACWLLRAYALRPSDLSVLNDLTRHLALLNKWQRRWMLRRLWHTYDSTWPAVSSARRQSRLNWAWELPSVIVSEEWERILREWAQNKRAGVVPFTRRYRFPYAEGMDSAQPC